MIKLALFAFAAMLLIPAVIGLVEWFVLSDSEELLADQIRKHRNEAID